jgi:outer membrane protein assembly factor BamB
MTARWNINEGGGMGKWSKKAGAWLVAFGLLVALTGGTSASGAATPEDWPTFGHDAGHSGVSGETAISASNAASLGIKWQVNTGEAVSASPVVAFNAVLNKRVVYVGNNAGVLSAYDAVTGKRLWFRQAGPRIVSTASVVNGTVYVGSSAKKLYALNGATGAVQCTFDAPGVIASSPVAVDPDGTGVVVYFGDNGLGGTDDGGHVWAVNGVDPNAAANCSQKWVFNGYGDPAGSQPNAGTWSPPAFGRDRNGRPLVVFGGSSPDDAIYAVDARTGARVWRRQANPDNKFDADVGAGPTISKPGNNGFVDGVVYVSGKENATYALNLRTGAVIWRFDIAGDSPGVEGYARSTAALVKNLLYVGYGAGVYQLNALTGAKLWKTPEKGPASGEVISSPALTGPEGSRVVAVGDLAGKVLVFHAGTGARLFNYTTPGQIYSSPAVSNGTIFIGSTDGFLYAFTPGGAPSGAPNTEITSPDNGSTVPNPDGSLVISGTASDNTKVSRVLFSVRNDNSHTWWDATSRTFKTTFTQNRATLGSPGAPTTTWSGSFGVPFGGGAFTVFAEAVDPGGLHDATPDTSSVFVDSLGQPPNTTITAPASDEVVHFPGGVRQQFDVIVRGTATDPGGTTRGIREVRVVVQNLEHGEYFCGPPGCNPFGDIRWVPDYSSPKATLASPGANSATWSMKVRVYDHPHSYMITAWAIDENGLIEQSRPTRTFCVRDADTTTCGGAATPASFAWPGKAHLCTLRRTSSL